MCRRQLIRTAAIVVTLAVFYAPAFADGPAATPATIPAADLYETIIAAHAQQRAMMTSMHFVAELDQGPANPSDPPAPPNMPRGATFVRHQLMSQDYQLDDSGRFILVTRQGDIDPVDQTKTWSDDLQHLGFDGKLYRFYDAGPTEPGGGSICPKDMPVDWSKPLIKPTVYMDHLFNPLLAKILQEKTGQLFPAANGNLTLSYKDATGESLEADLDPARSFIVTRMTGRWTATQTYEKRIEYASTREGFYYPLKGTLSLDGRRPVVLEISAFELNPKDPNYTLRIPDGTRVTDHRFGRRRIYEYSAEAERNNVGP